MAINDVAKTFKKLKTYKLLLKN